MLCRRCWDRCQSCSQKAPGQPPRPLQLRSCVRAGTQTNCAMSWAANPPIVSRRLAPNNSLRVVQVTFPCSKLSTATRHRFYHRPIAMESHIANHRSHRSQYQWKSEPAIEALYSVGRCPRKPGASTHASCPWHLIQCPLDRRSYQVPTTARRSTSAVSYGGVAFQPFVVSPAGSHGGSQSWCSLT